MTLSSTPPHRPGAALRCAGCGQPWFSGQDRCSNCGTAETTTRLAGPKSAILAAPMRAAEPQRPTEVVITRIRLSWSDAFDIFGKFAAVFIFWQLITAVVVYLLIRIAS